MGSAEAEGTPQCFENCDDAFGHVIDCRRFWNRKVTSGTRICTFRARNLALSNHSWEKYWRRLLKFGAQF